VEPGFGGQSFMNAMLPKLKSLSATAAAGQIIAVDGGIDPVTASLAARSGAELFIAGNAIFKTDNPIQAIARLREAVNA